VIGRKGLLSWTDDGYGCPWLSAAFRSFTARSRPQRAPPDGLILLLGFVPSEKGDAP
jgi:hypothetical protein